MNYENVIVDIGDDFIGTISLNRPKNLNTFNISLANELTHALRDLDSLNQVRVIIVKGAGKVFCAGIDIGDFSNKTASEYRDWIDCMEKPIVTISQMKKPVIAQVHGVAAANGAGLVAGADLAIASDDAKFGLTAINVGLNCVGPVVPVTKSVGRKKALELLLFGDLIKAQQALEMGLINWMAPAADLNEETRNRALQLAQKSPIALQNAKSSFYTAADQDYHKAFSYMNEAFARLCTTEDAKEGIDAFLTKRKPEWKEK